jgi:hypothetical protein
VPGGSRALPTTRRPRRVAALRRYLPPQHGAWAMLVVPYLAGVLVAGWSWVAAPLAGGWLAGYLLSYYAFRAVKGGWDLRGPAPAGVTGSR